MSVFVSSRNITRVREEGPEPSDGGGSRPSAVHAWHRVRAKGVVISADRVCRAGRGWCRGSCICYGAARAGPVWQRRRRRGYVDGFAVVAASQSARHAAPTALRGTRVRATGRRVHASLPVRRRAHRRRARRAAKSRPNEKQHEGRDPWDPRSAYVERARADRTHPGRRLRRGGRRVAQRHVPQRRRGRWPNASCRRRPHRGWPHAPSLSRGGADPSRRPRTSTRLDSLGR